MNTFAMIIWSFVIRAIPLKKIFTCIACVLVLVTGIAFIGNYSESFKESTGAIFASDGE